MIKKLLLLGLAICFSLTTKAQEYLPEVYTVQFNYLSIFDSENHKWITIYEEVQNTFVFKEDNTINHYTGSNLVDTYTKIGDTATGYTNDSTKYILFEVINSKGRSEFMQLFSGTKTIRQLYKDGYIEYTIFK